MTLKQLILQNELENSTAAQIATALNAPSVDRTDTTKVGPFNLFKKLTERHGLNSATAKATCDAVCGAFESAGAASAWMRSNLAAFSAAGMDFADSDTRSFIDQIFTGSDEATQLGTMLKAIGIWQISKAEAANLGTITQQQATAALAEIAEDAIEATRSAIKGQLDNDVVIPGDWSTKEELKALIAAW